MNVFWDGFRRSESSIRRVALYSLILNISLVFSFQNNIAIFNR